MSHNEEKGETWKTRLVRLITGNDAPSSSSDKEQTEVGSLKSSQGSNGTRLPSFQSKPSKPSTDSVKSMEREESIQRLAWKLVKEKYSASLIETQLTNPPEEIAKLDFEVDLKRAVDAYKIQASAFEASTMEEQRFLEAKRNMEDKIKDEAQKVSDDLKEKLRSAHDWKRLTTASYDEIGIREITPISVEPDLESVGVLVDMMIDASKDMTLRINEKVDADLRISDEERRAIYLYLSSDAKTYHLVGEFRFNSNASFTMIDNAKLQLIGHIVKELESGK